MPDDSGSASPARRNLAGAAGTWSARHRGVVISAWLLFVIPGYLVGGFI